MRDAETLAPRRIAAGDIMILVRSRGAFFEAMIRALKEARVKTAGADRLSLRDSIAVMDLIAVGRSALLPDDDLTLAAALKSPLVGLDDDDLMALAPQRAGSLAQALAESADPRFAAARRRLEAWRRRAGSHSPYMFYARLVGEDGGRRALLARLGPEVADAIDEFMALALAHEQKAAPSLDAFLAEIEATDIADQARHGRRRRQRARDDRPRRQGPGGADRVPARHVLGAACAQRRQAHRPRRRRARRTAAVGLGDEEGRRFAAARRRSPTRARGRRAASIAACSMSR